MFFLRWVVAVYYHWGLIICTICEINTRVLSTQIDLENSFKNCMKKNIYLCCALISGRLFFQQTLESSIWKSNLARTKLVLKVVQLPGAKPQPHPGLGAGMNFAIYLLQIALERAWWRGLGRQQLGWWQTWRPGLPRVKPAADRSVSGDWSWIWLRLSEPTLGPQGALPASEFCESGISWVPQSTAIETTMKCHQGVFSSHGIKPLLSHWCRCSFPPSQHHTMAMSLGFCFRVCSFIHGLGPPTRSMGDWELPVSSPLPRVQDSLPSCSLQTPVWLCWGVFIEFRGKTIPGFHSAFAPNKLTFYFHFPVNFWSTLVFLNCRTNFIISSDNSSLVLHFVARQPRPHVLRSRPCQLVPGWGPSFSA